MKYLIILFLFSFLLISCGEKNKETIPAQEQKNKFAYDTSDIKSTPINETGRSYKLKYKFKKNKTYYYRISTFSTDLQKIGTKDTSMSQVFNQKAIYLADFNLKNVDKDSTLEVGCKISSIKLDANSNQNSISYESGVTPDSVVKKSFAEYDALINNEFDLRVTPSGEVSDISKVDEIMNKYLKMKGMADSININQKDQLRMQIKEGVLKPLVIQIFKKLPDNPVAKDSSWSISHSPTSIAVFQTQNTTKYKVTGLEKSGDEKLAVIQEVLTAKITGNKTTTKNGIVYSFKKPVTDVSGKIYFNLSRGLLQKSKASTKINISFSMEMQTPQGKQKQNREEETTTTNVVELL